MSVLDQLQDHREEVRLRAIRRAGTSGEPGVAEALLHIALYDDAEVRTPGGLSESFENLGDEAATVLGRLLRAEIDPRIRAAALDPAQDDDRVAKLLYYLGPSYEPLRRELAAHEMGRLRLRAVRATLPYKWNAEMVERLLGDTAGEVRREVLSAPGLLLSDETCLRLLRDDPDPGVRFAAARRMRFSRRVGSEPFIAAAADGTAADPALRSMLLFCLVARRRDRPNARAIAAFLGSPVYHDRREAAEALRDVDDEVVAAAIARRVLVEPDQYILSHLNRYRHRRPAD